MRTLILGVFLFLAACNGSDTTQVVQKVPYSDPALVAKVDALTKALASATAAQAQQAQALGKLQLIGKVHGTASAERVLAIGRAAAVAANFGPCTDMGVLIGRSGGATPMSGNVQSFQTCQGYEYSVDSNTGTILPLIAIEWSDANCTGTPYSSVGQIPAQLASNGAVFELVSAGKPMMIVAGTSSISALVSSEEDNFGICSNITSPGNDTVYPIQDNSVSITGVPSSISVPYSIAAP